MNTFFILFPLIISLIIIVELIVGIFIIIWSKSKKTEDGLYLTNKFKNTHQFWIILSISIILTSCCCLIFIPNSKESIATITPPIEQVSILVNDITPSITMQPSLSLSLPTETIQFTLTPLPSLSLPTETKQFTLTTLPSLSLPTKTIQFTQTPLPILINTEAVQPKQELINNNIMVAFVDVGQGDAVLIRSPEGYYGLIDGGEENSGVLQYLQKEGVNNLDLIIATHPHSDHIGGLISVLHTIPTNRVVTNGELHTTLTYEKFLDAIYSSEAEYIEVIRGDKLLLGSLTLEVLNPSYQLQDDMNANSLVLRMSFMNTTFLFMGDAFYNTEYEIMRSNLPLNAEILKVAHHGSNNSTSTDYLNIVKPTIAIYTSGLGNSYGHPHMETLNTLSTSGAKILGTDVNGTIVFIVDETGYSFDVAKDGQIKIQTSTPITTITQTSIPITTITQAPIEKPFIDVISLTSPINAGSNANLVIKTKPAANCSITVFYKSGPSQADGLGDQIADATGKVSWTWKVGSRTTPGTWEIVVRSSYDGETISIEIPFEVK